MVDERQDSRLHVALLIAREVILTLESHCYCNASRPDLTQNFELGSREHQYTERMRATMECARLLSEGIPRAGSGVVRNVRVKMGFYEVTQDVTSSIYIDS